MRQSAWIPALSIAAGIAAGISGPTAVHPAALVCAWCAALLAFVARRDMVATICLIAGFAGAGAIEGERASRAALNTPLAELFKRHIPIDGGQLAVTLEGSLRADAIRSPSGVTLSVAIDGVSVGGHWQRSSGGVLVSVGGVLGANRLQSWRSGRRVRMSAALRRATRYLNDGVPDNERQSAWRGTALVGFVKSDRLVEVISSGGPIAEAAAAVRAAVRSATQVNIAPWSPRSAAVVTAILIGDRAGLEQEDERRLQKAGTYHVIAISGGNIAMLAGIFLVGTRLLRMGDKATSLVLMCGLGGYALIAEGGVSVSRATLMASIYFGGRLADLRPLPANVVAVCAAALLIASPLQLIDPGMALTFGATLGIVVGMSRFATKVSAWWLRPVVLLLGASVFAEVALLPVSAFVFSRVTAAGLVVNFAAIPLMGLAQSAGIATVLLASAGSALALFAGGVAHLAVQGLIESAALVDFAPWLTRRVPPPSMMLIAIYYVSLVAFVALTSRWRQVSAVCLGICVVGIVGAPAWPRSSDRPLRVTFLDVGQGDAAIVQFPNGRTLVIDAGGSTGSSFDVGMRVVTPSLWALGARTLDYLVLSHGDIDHIGGAPSLIQDFSPREIWEGISVPPHVALASIRAAANERGIPWRTVRPGATLRFGEVAVIVRHPPDPEWERQRVRNDDSVVLELRYGGVSFVLTGDIGAEVEQGLIKSIRHAPIRIVKVPHHGSSTSSSSKFVSAIRPDVAVVSCGRGNVFGHPAPAVISRYVGAGAAIFRTDRDGEIVVETDGTKVKIRSYTGRRLTLRASPP